MSPRRLVHGLLTDYWWLIIIAAIILMVMRRYARGKIKTGGNEREFDEDDELAAAPRSGSRAVIYPDFGAVLERVVLPLSRANPNWERLDGAYGAPARQVARFDRGGTVYALNSDSKVAALRAAAEWMESNPGEDPLIVKPTKKGVGRLTLRPEIGWEDGKAVQIATV